MLSQQSADILLVEDDVNDAELALAALRQRNISEKVVHVVDGNEALSFISYASLFGDWGGGNLPKVILLDLKLKTINGLDVLRQLKSEDHTKTIPVVVFTGSQREIELVESYRLGVNSYVIKPSDHKEYAQIVGDIGHYWVNINRPSVF
jgi:two-component system, response regulator